MSPLAIEVVGLTKTFGGSTAALNGVSFSVPAGTVCGVLGHNGAGKTTTINILSTLIRPTSGRAIVSGYDVMRQPGKVRASIGMAGQFTGMDPLLTGRENLVLFGRLRGLRRQQAKARADELLEQFDLVGAADRRVSTYSGGMWRRVDLASALVVLPKVLFLDEPTTGLDPRSRRAMWSLVSSLALQGVTVLLTTQYLEEADVLSDSDRGHRPRAGDRQRHGRGPQAQGGHQLLPGDPGRSGRPASASRRRWPGSKASISTPT